MKSNNTTTDYILVHNIWYNADQVQVILGLKDMKHRYNLFFGLCFSFFFSFSVYGQTPGEWTWMHGDNVLNSAGAFGIQGVANAANKPPALYEPCEWKDNQGNFWLFGGSNGTNIYAALWKYDPVANQWTWMKGPSFINQPAIYGAQGVAAPANHPGSRGSGVTTWVDNAGKLWLFGGSPSGGTSLNDLWKYDPATNNWTWVKGPNVTTNPGSYGTLGVPAATNVPPSRWETSCSWTDGAGDLWFYGGYSPANSFGDLWRYNIAANAWTWMHGSNGTNAPPVYGIQGVAAPANTPGGRLAYASWVDLAGNFWLFGGWHSNSGGFYNDLWKYDPTVNQWTWVKGPNTTNNTGSYGTKCVPSSSNLPPARGENRARVRDTCGNFWNFGGEAGYYNDLWHYNVSTNQWTWASGDNVGNQPAVYGTQGTSAPANKPGAKAGSVAWIDNNGYIWVFGGSRYNDLFRYVPDPACTPMTAIVNASSNTTICSGQNATLTATGGTSYSWSPGAQTTSSIVVTPTASTTYTVTGTGTCGSGIDSVRVIISSTPPSITASSSNITICNGQNATLTATGGTNYSWSHGGQTTSSIVVSPTGSTTYTVTGSNICGSNTATATVIVSQPPVASTSGTSICSGQSATLTASGGGNYSWSTAETTSSITVSPTGNATYTVIVSMGSCTDTATASVAVAPGVTANISGNTVLCTGDATTLTATGGTNYSWSNGTSTNAIIVNPSSTTTYTVVTSNSSGCAAINSVTVTVSSPPVASILSTTICAGQTATLIATGGGSYSWNTGSTTASTTVSPTNNASYSVTVSIGTCTATASGNVVVNPNPAASAAGNVTITQGQSTVLSASGGGNYTWSNGDNGSPITVSPNTTTLYCVTVTDANNCTDTSCVTVFVEPMDCSAEIYLPNAFSPNHDGENDMLQLYYVNIACIKALKLTIYDRWGEKVFETNDPAFTWSGIYKSKHLNTAVFVYYLDVTLISAEQINKKGNVSLIR